MQVQIWDASRAKQIRELSGHTNRVSSVAWNSSMLSSGGRDSAICNWDVRKRRDEACVAKVVSHEQASPPLHSVLAYWGRFIIHALAASTKATSRPGGLPSA